MNFHDSSLVSDLERLTESKVFIGREFLTWLWFAIERDQGLLTINVLGRNVNVECWIDDFMQFSSSETRREESHLKGGKPAASPEAGMALATGKMLRQIRLGIRSFTGDEYFVGLRSDDLSPRNLALPKSEEKLSGVPALEFRMSKTRDFFQLFDGLFSRFMQERSQTTWQDLGLEEVRDWIRRRQPASEVLQQ